MVLLDFTSQSMMSNMPGGGGPPGGGGGGPPGPCCPPPLLPPVVLPLGALCPNGMQPGTLATFEPGTGQIGVPTLVQTVLLAAESQLQ